MTLKEKVNALVIERNRLDKLVLEYRDKLNRTTDERNILHTALSQILDIKTEIATPAHMRQAIRAAQSVVDNGNVRYVQ